MKSEADECESRNNYDVPECLDLANASRGTLPMRKPSVDNISMQLLTHMRESSLKSASNERAASVVDQGLIAGEVGRDVLFCDK